MKGLSSDFNLVSSMKTFVFKSRDAYERACRGN